MTAPTKVRIYAVPFAQPCGKIGDRFTDKAGQLLTPICTLPLGHAGQCRWLKR